jgi:hypothetical protein
LSQLSKGLRGTPDLDDRGTPLLSEKYDRDNADSRARCAVSGVIIEKRALSYPTADRQWPQRWEFRHS